MDSMIQTLNMQYYNASKYARSHIAAFCTKGKQYNLLKRGKSNPDILNEWIDVCRENCRRFTKVASRNQPKKNVLSEKISEQTKKKERRQTYLANDKQALYDKVNHPNYNPFSPLLEAEEKGRVETVETMDEND
jgi:hypothetical protein